LPGAVESHSGSEDDGLPGCHVINSRRERYHTTTRRCSSDETSGDIFTADSFSNSKHSRWPGRRGGHLEDVYKRRGQGGHGRGSPITPEPIIYVERVIPRGEGGRESKVKAIAGSKRHVHGVLLGRINCGNQESVHSRWGWRRGISGPQTKGRAVPVL